MSKFNFIENMNEAASIVVGTIKEMVTEDTPQMVKTITSIMSFNKNILNDNEIGDEVFENLDDNNEIYQGIKNLENDKSQSCDSEINHSSSNNELDNDISDEKIDEKPVEKSDEKPVQKYGKFDNLLSSFFGMKKFLEKNVHKTTFSFYSNLKITDCSTHTQIELKEIADEIMDFLQQNEYDANAVKANEYKSKILKFYKCYNLLLLEELNLKISDINKKIIAIDENPYEINTEKILLDICPK
jgi:hypothetical protein